MRPYTDGGREPSHSSLLGWLVGTKFTAVFLGATWRVGGDIAATQPLIRVFSGSVAGFYHDLLMMHVISFGRRPHSMP